MTGTLLQAEFVRSMRLARAYWLEYASDFVLYFLGFLLLMVVFGAASPVFSSQGVLEQLDRLHHLESVRQ